MNVYGAAASRRAASTICCRNASPRLAVTFVSELLALANKWSVTNTLQVNRPSFTSLTMASQKRKQSGLPAGM